jgi:hypothetical protein
MARAPRHSPRPASHFGSLAQAREIKSLLAQSPRWAQGTKLKLISIFLLSQARRAASTREPNCPEACAGHGAGAGHEVAWATVWASGHRAARALMWRRRNKHGRPDASLIRTSKMLDVSFEETTSPKGLLVSHTCPPMSAPSSVRLRTVLPQALIRMQWQSSSNSTPRATT